MKKSLNNEILIEIFNRDFQNVEFEYIESDFGGKIHCFFMRFTNEDDMSYAWNKISNAIAVYFQSVQPDEFSKWNIYLFYLSSEVIKKELKYKIENNTFSSRKIVLDDCKLKMTNENLMKIVSDKIIGSSIKNITPIKQTKEEYKSNSSIWEIITEIDLKSGKGNVIITGEQLEKIQKKLSNEI